MRSPRRPNPVFTDEYQALTAVIVAARREAGVSQRALAHRLGKANSHICMIERGQRRIDALELMQMAGALGVSPSTLVARIEVGLAQVAARSSPAQAAE